jgi:hypothetical protein
MRVCTLLLATFVLSGCATREPPLAQELVASVKRISVVSVTALDFNRQHSGWTAFGNEREQRPIAEWAIDRDYEKQIGAAAERVFGATYVNVQGPHALFSSVNDLSGPRDAPAFWWPNFQNIEQSAKDFCKQQTLDALIVVARQKTTDPLLGSSHALSGAGIFTKSSYSALHLLSVVSLLNCNTGKPMATRVLAQRNTYSNGRVYFAPVNLLLPEEVSRIPLSAWTPELESRIRQNLKSLPERAWEDTLRTMVSDSQ